MSGDRISLKELREAAAAFQQANDDFHAGKPDVTLEAADTYEQALADPRVLLALVEAVDALNEGHEYQCGCDRPGNPAACVAQPIDVFAALARFKDYEGEA